MKKLLMLHDTLIDPPIVILPLIEQSPALKYSNRAVNFFFTKGDGMTYLVKY